MRTAGEIGEGCLIGGDHAGPGAALDGHVADGHAGLHRELFDGAAAVLDDMTLGPVGADPGDDGQDDVLGSGPGGQVAVDAHAHRLERRDGQSLGGEHMLDLTGADAESQCPEGAVSGGVGVAAYDGHARLGQTQLGADGVDDALIGVAQGVQAHTELGAVGAQRLDLGAAGDVGDRQVDVERGGVVVLGGQGQVGTADPATRQTQPLEGLGAGDLVDEVEVDVEQIGSSVRALRDDVVAPDLLGEGHSHRCVSFPFPEGPGALRTLSPSRRQSAAVRSRGSAVALPTTVRGAGQHDDRS